MSRDVYLPANTLLALLDADVSECERLANDPAAGVNGRMQAAGAARALRDTRDYVRAWVEREQARGGAERAPLDPGASEGSAGPRGT